MALALALTTAWGVKRASADSVSCGINEITFTTGGVNSQPAINSDGTRIVFVSDRDLTGENADHNSEIFLYDTKTNSFTQITNTTVVGNFEPSISSDGAHIAFKSNGFPLGNPDGNDEIFLFNSITGGIAQITFTTGGNFSNTNPSINSDGTRIAIKSNRDLTGGNADGNVEIFLYDTQSNSFTQVTSTTGDPTPGRQSIQMARASLFSPAALPISATPTATRRSSWRPACFHRQLRRPPLPTS